MIRRSKTALLSSSALLLLALDNAAFAQDVAGTSSGASNVQSLPSIEVTAPKQTASAPRKPKTHVAARHPVSSTAASSRSDSTVTQPASQEAVVAAKNGAFDQARGNIFTTVGTSSNTIGHDTIADLPQGPNQSVEQVLLQAPGVTQDSAASGLLHIRNEHGNIQYRINGVMLPDGVTGFGSIFDTSFIGKMSLVTGALPAEFGLRTSGIVDITTRTDLFNNSGSVGFYGGSHGTVAPNIDFGVTSFNSALLNENQVERTSFSVLALQKSVDGFDGQLSYFTRYNELRYTPDPIGDLLINGIASDIGRISYTNGIAGDGSYKLNGSHTLRAGFSVSGEQAAVSNTSLVENLDNNGVGTEPPIGITDNVSKLGWLASVYVQDEWKLTNQLTINAGLRFDQMDQFVSANQFSPRLSVTYKPFENTTFHAGYARYFTPPTMVEAAPTNVALFNNTTGAASPGVPNDAVLPERSHYFDVGVDQTFKFWCGSDGKCSSLDLGVDAYYKIATDLLDNGLFGQALVLTAFNYANGYNDGIEFKAKWTSGNFQAYGNIAVAQQRATNPVSNQFLFDNTTPLADLGGLTELQYLQSHYVYTDHNQFVTASAGAVYKFCGRPATAAEAFGYDGLSWCGVTLSGDLIYGSGLRDGDANIGSVPGYTQVNLGIKREFLLPNDPKPMTIRFDVVNLFDKIYEIRDGSGIGVFAPQFGPRRGFFLGISKKI
jgi:hypothetical protein